MPIQLRAATSAVLLTLLASASVPLIAQEQVTVLRRNGERVSGRFEAWNRGNDSVYIRVTPGDQRIIPMRDVAVIAVGGDAQNLPANEVQAAGTRRGGQVRLDGPPGNLVVKAPVGIVVDGVVLPRDAVVIRHGLIAPVGHRLRLAA